MPKRKRDDSELTDEERARRERQREMQQQALAARASGGSFESTRRTTFPKRKPLEARKEEERKLRRKAENASKRRASQKALKQQRANAPDVVVVPIFWKGEAKQMARVLSACADIEAALKETEWSHVELDTGHKYTPGQKFAHWEHKGVRLRIEVGPREAEKGTCTLARTFTPGEPAHRVPRVPVGARTLSEELSRLHALAAPAAEDDATGDAEPSEAADEWPVPTGSKARAAHPHPHSHCRTRACACPHAHACRLPIPHAGLGSEGLSRRTRCPARRRRPGGRLRRRRR